MYSSYQLVKTRGELHCSLTKAVCNEHNDEITPQQRLEHTALFWLFCTDVKLGPSHNND